MKNLTPFMGHAQKAATSTLRRGALHTGASALVLGAMLVATPATAASPSVRVEIEAQPLSTALYQFGVQTGLAIGFAEAKVKGKQAQALTGDYAPKEALEQLLKGSGLSYEFIDARTVRIVSDAAGAAPQQQEDNPQEAAFVLEEIIVTAEKRAESLQDIPIAISAFSDERMNRAGVSGVSDLKQLAPSLQFGGQALTSFVSIRGIGTDLINIGAESGVTISQDGVVFSRSMFFDADFMDVERVEVLRGPQGTISGRNSTGGSINIHSKRPTEEFEGGFKLTFGNYNRFSTNSYLSGPLMGDKLQGRIAFSTDDSNGWLTNTFLNEKTGSRDKVHVRASLLALPAENLEVLFIADAINDRSNPIGQLARGRVLSDVPSVEEELDISLPDFDNLTFEADQGQFRDVEQYGFTLGIVWDLSPDATLTSTTGYISRTSEASSDYDGSLLAGSQSPFVAFDIWQFTQELTLTADLTDKMDLILGGLYVRDSAGEPIDYVSIPAGISLLEGRPDQDLASYSVYSQLRYQLTNDLRISAGLRYTHDKKTLKDMPTLNGSALGLFEAERSWNAVTPRLAIDYAINDDVTLFANVARGFKAGGMNTYTYPIDDFNPELVWNYEAGVKSILWNGRAHVGLTGFYSDYTDLQQNVLLTGEGAQFFRVENAAAATIKGLEFEVDAQISEAFRINGSATWLDAKFKELFSEDALFPDLGIRDLSGNKMIRAPEWQFTIGGEYAVPISNELLGVMRLDYQWQDKVYFDFYNRDLVGQNAYGLLNFNIAVEAEDGRWQISIFGKNILDKRYFNSSYVEDIGYRKNLATLGEPRMYGISLAHHF